MPSVSEAQHRAMEAAVHGHSTLGIPEAVGKEFVAADSASQDCAGILFRAPGPHYLLVKRSDTGEWEQPGGHLEEGESEIDAAVRECLEEVGVCPDGERIAVRRTPLAGGSEYTCFLQNVSLDAFDSLVLNNEHTKWRWAHPGGLPKPMHREVAKTIELLTGHELDIAKRVAAGQLLSPQRYENLWLFDVRITGTGTAYRPKHEEVAYRTQENFLTDDFLERCNGLPLIFEHPEDKPILTTEEYRNRAIGTVILPYIKGDEVWGVAKVFDADAAKLMQTTHASTSPAVVFRDAGSTETVEVDGIPVLIEGKPSYLDHLAICAVGVWDKGGEPSGVSNSGEITMDEKEVPAWADALMKRMDSVCSRMDSMEEKSKEAEVKADEDEKAKEKAKEEESRKDSEAEAEKAGEKEKAEEKKAAEAIAEAEKEGEKERKEERADSVSLADVEALRSQLATLTRPLTNEDRDALAAAQARADGIAQLFGQEASAPLHGESPIDYRKRLAAKLQKHSAKMADVRLDSMDGPAFDLVEERIYADAAAFARSPEQRKAGLLIPITRRDAAGRNVTTFEGDIGSWLQHFKSPGHGVRFNRAKEAA